MIQGFCLAHIIHTLSYQVGRLIPALPYYLHIILFLPFIPNTNVPQSSNRPGISTHTVHAGPCDNRLQETDITDGIRLLTRDNNPLIKLRPVLLQR